MNRLLTFLMILWLVLGGVAEIAAQAPTQPSSAERPPPIIQFMLAGVALGLILMILCMPTRKGHAKGD